MEIKQNRSCSSKSIRKLLCLLLLTALLFSCAAPVFSGGGEGRKLRVGYMDHPGFIEKRGNGEFYGYGVEYLNDICSYTGWEIEYVYASWAEQLEMLERGELDLVGLAQHSKEREEKFLFSRQGIGLIQGLLLALPESESYIEASARGCDGRTIGILRGSHNKDILAEYAKEMGFSYILKEYDYQSDLETALLRKTVDIIASEQMLKTDDLRILDRFTSDPYYFISSKENAALMEELNYTISKINAYDPVYTAKLYDKYFGTVLRGNTPYFTSAEAEFISSSGVIPVVLPPNSKPIIYADEEGRPAGVVYDVMERISELSGLSFSYIFVPEGCAPLDFLKEHPEHLAAGVLSGNPAIDEGGFLLTNNYYSSRTAMVSRIDHADRFDFDSEDHTVALPTSFQAMRLFLKENYPRLSCVNYPSVEACLQALEDKQVDYFAYIYNTIVPYLSNPRYSDIVIVDSHMADNYHCTVAMDSPENRLIIGIMNKCISMISEEDVLRMDSLHLESSLYQFDQKDVVARYKEVILIGALVIVAVFAFIGWRQMIRQRKYNRDIMLHAQYDMMTGLYNRATLGRKGKAALEENPGKSCALIAINIDNMKNLNDSRGTNAGDEAIRGIANVLKEHFRGSALLGRAGGDEFGVVLVGIESKSALVPILTRLQQAISSITVSGGTATLSVSIGVSMGVASENTFEEYARQAVEALNRVKKSTKNGFAFYESKSNLSVAMSFPELQPDVQPKAEGQPKAEASGESFALKEQTGSNDLLPLESTGQPLQAGSLDFKRLFDTLPNVCIYVIDKSSHSVLFYNKRFKEICPQVKLGISCRNLMFGPCQNCIVDTIGEKAVAHTIFYSDIFGGEVEITATQFVWEGMTPAVMISTWPRNLVSSSSDSLISSSNQDSLDYVTGGLTRTGFIRMMERMQRGGVDLTEYAVLFLNIKDFKAVNEMVGSAGGDNLLRSVFTRIEQSDLHPVIGSRSESDHFVFMVERSLLQLPHLPELLNFHWQYSGRDMFIHCRCGVFMIDDPALAVYKMIDRAKLAKEHIVDDYVQPYAVYDSFMLEEYSERATAFLLFDNGIKNNEFVVYYQPVVDAKTERVVGAEALVRRKTADGTIISPGKFIPILERSGYISMLDRFVAEEVARFVHGRIDEQQPIVPVSFNLSQKDFYDAELMELITKNLADKSFPQDMIMFELTESTYTMNEKRHGEYLKQLRDAGAKILLDDFGTGYSSFGMFENYNFDRVKLDMSFVRQLADNPNVRKVVRSIIAMCHELSVQVVAEGVETEAELRILREMDCDLIQGYYFARPLPQNEFEDYLRMHQ